MVRELTLVSLAVLCGGCGAGDSVVAPGARTVIESIELPEVEIQRVRTSIPIPDGGTVLLGGLKESTKQDTRSGVPILNKIPYVSRLFKNTGVGRDTVSLMLMVTPRIIIQE